jgi:hypothetical protein
MSLRRRAVACFGLTLAACSDQDCATVGCSDEAVVVIVSQTGKWADGSYTLDVAFDDTSHSCTFEAPSDAGSKGTWQPIDCTPELAAYLAPVVKCSEHQSGQSQSQTCGPVPDAFYLQATEPGTPATFSVTLTRAEDEVLLDESGDVPYTTAQPNGPECGPTCKQAFATYVLELE